MQWHSSLTHELTVGLGGVEPHCTCVVDHVHVLNDRGKRLRRRAVLHAGYRGTSAEWLLRTLEHLSYRVAGRVIGLRIGSRVEGEGVDVIGSRVEGEGVNVSVGEGEGVDTSGIDCHVAGIW